MPDQGDGLQNIRQEDVLWLLGSLCVLYRIPFDASLIIQDNPPPYTLVSVLDAAQALGIKCSHSAVAGIDWQKLRAQRGPAPRC